MNAPEWTNMITNNVLCGFFYIFFIVFSVWAAISLIGGIWIFATTKMSFGMLIAVLFNVILSFGIAATQALFHYLICERALKPSMVGGKVRNATSQVGSAADYEMM